MCLVASAEIRDAITYRARDLLLGECASTDDKYKKFTYFPIDSDSFQTEGVGCTKAADVSVYEKCKSNDAATPTAGAVTDSEDDGGRAIAISASLIVASYLTIMY